MTGQALVQECIVCIQQFHERVILAHHAFEEEFRFRLKGFSRGSRRNRETRIGQAPTPERGEVGATGPPKLLTKSLGARIAQHTLNLLLQNGGLLQPAAFSQSQQLVVGDGAPQKKR